MRTRIFLVAFLVCTLFEIALLTAEVRLQPIPLWREGNLSDSDPDLERLNSALVRFAERVRPAVVHIRAVPSSTAATNNARGSGFIINPQGYILTAHHVVAGAKEIEIRLTDGQRFRGQMVGTDPQVDFAIIKFNAEREFPALSLGDSDTLRVGEMVGSLGYPLVPRVPCTLASSVGVESDRMGLAHLTMYKRIQEPTRVRAVVR